MTHAFKIRYANILVGGLVLLVLLLLVVGTILIGNKKHWFENPYTIEGKLPFRRTLGLTEGTSVNLMDANVGEVSAIHYHTNGQVMITLTINALFKPFIRTNAIGIVRKEFGVVGEQRIFLQQEEVGATYADIADLPPMRIEPDVDVISTLIAAANEVSSQLPQLVSDGRSTVSNVMALTSQLSDPRDGIQPLVRESTAVLGEVHSILKTVQTGDGSIAKLLNDPKFSADLHRVVSSLSQTMEEVRNTLKRVQDLSRGVDPLLEESTRAITSIQAVIKESKPLLQNTTRSMERVPAALSSANRALEPVPNTLWELNAMLEELNLLLRGLQKNWLLRGGVEKAKACEADKAAPDVGGHSLLIP